MGEVVNVLVAFAVIVLLFRWVTSSTCKESPRDRSAADTLGFRPKNVTQEMVDTIHNMFPDIPADNIRYDLLRTGNVQLTSTKILEKGFLDAPPPSYYTLFPRTAATDPATTTHPAAGGSATVTAAKESLISRYRLQDRIAASSAVTGDQMGGKAVWEDTAEKREASLKERKAQMILAARQRFAAQQQSSAAPSNRP